MGVGISHPLCLLFTKNSVMALGFARELTIALTLPTRIPFVSVGNPVLITLWMVLVLLWYVSTESEYPLVQLRLLRMRLLTWVITLPLVPVPA